jgi:sec-independent protein translocase protein TatB
MFDIGFSELVVIGLVALIVLGPKRLPEVARMAGQWAGRLRRFVDNVKQDLDREMNQAELSELKKLKQELDETRQAMESTTSKLMQDISGPAYDAQAALTRAIEQKDAEPTIAPPATTPPALTTRVAAPTPKRTRTRKTAKSRKTLKSHGRARRKQKR